MANIRTLKLNLLADVSGFEKGIKKASGQSESFAKKLGRNFAIAGAAIGGAAIAFGVDAVKAFAEDERGQRKLQVALKNTTKATLKQRRAVEDFISRTQKQYGVVDDKLRPAFQRLVQATGSVSKSQKLMKLVLDASAASGKDVETVAAAVSKAYAGNSASLGRLGLGIKSSTLKTKDFNKIMEEMAHITKGQATAAANSLDGKLTRFKIAMDEAKESIGGAIVTGLQPLADKYLPTITDGITQFVGGLTGTGQLTDAITDSSEAARLWGERIRGTIKYLLDHKDGLGKIAAITAGIFLGAKAGMAIAGMASAIGKLVGLYRGLAVASATAAGAEAAATGGASLWAAAPAIGAIAGAFLIPSLMQLANTPQQDSAKTITKKRVYNGQTYQYDESKKKWYVPDISGNRDYSVQPPANTKRNFMSRSSTSGGTTIINLNGIVDGESARRNIERILQKSSIQSGPINLNGSVI